MTVNASAYLRQADVFDGLKTAAPRNLGTVSAATVEYDSAKKNGS